MIIVVVTGKIYTKTINSVLGRPTRRWPGYLRLPEFTISSRRFHDTPNTTIIEAIGAVEQNTAWQASLRLNVAHTSQRPGRSTKTQGAMSKHTEKAFINSLWPRGLVKMDHF